MASQHMRCPTALNLLNQESNLCVSHNGDQQDNEHFDGCINAGKSCHQTAMLLQRNSNT